MNPYTPEELERIEKLRSANESFESHFIKQREDWNNAINPLFEDIRNSFNVEKTEKVIEIQSLALSYRQKINDQISYFLNRRSREDSKLKKIKQDKFIFYAISFGIKTNNSDKLILIEGNIAENERTIQLIDAHIEYLRSCSKNLESLGFTIKNIIELLNYLK